MLSRQQGSVGMSMLDCDLCNLNVSNRTDRSVSGGGGEGGGNNSYMCIMLS